MTKILYADKELYDEDSKMRKKSLSLIEKLKQEGFNVEVADDFEILELFTLFNIIPSSIVDYEKRFNRLLETFNQYDFLISHLGINSPKNLSYYILPKLPNLKVAFISDVSNLYEVGERMSAFGYESPELFDFLRINNR